MKKFSSILFFALLLCIASFGQLTGTKTIPGTAPTGYPTIAASIQDLNTNGVGAGGVTFNIAAGYTETFATPSAGLITATGTSDNRIVFRKNGTGADPVITAGTGISTTLDGIIVIAGGDYLTFDGIDLAENPANDNPTCQMEWGYALVKARPAYPVDGCQYVTIKNCTITLNKANTTSVGIYAGNHSPYSATVTNNITSFADVMNNCKFNSNTITNVGTGIKCGGWSNAPLPYYDLYNSNNDYGVDGANYISNFYSYGMNISQEKSVKVWNNLINDNTVVTSTSLYGIYVNVCASTDIYNNTVTLIPTAGNVTLTGMNIYAGETTFTGNIYFNKVQNCSNATSTTAGFTGISTAGYPTNLNIYNNEVANNSNPSYQGFAGIIASGSIGTNLNMHHNTVANNTKTWSGTSAAAISCIKVSCQYSSIHDNYLYNNAIVSTGVNTYGATIYGIANNSGPTIQSVYNNQIHNLTISGTTSSTANVIYGLYSSVATTTQNWYGNSIDTLAINTATGTVHGIYSQNATASNVYRNQVYNLRADGASGVAYGINFQTGTSAMTANIYNNFISDLRTPAASNTLAIAGINLGVTGALGLAARVFYNTVYLNASSSGTNFGTAALYAHTTPTLDLRDNVLVNVSTPAGTGITAAYRRSSTTLTSFLSTSNNNDFYSGATEDGTHSTYYDGSAYAMAAYQALVNPRESGSFRELPPFLNVATVPYDLHLNTGIATLCESGGVPVITPITITDDIDGNTRLALPDAGADEFAGISAGVVNPSNFLAAVGSSRQVNLSFTPNPSNNTVVIVWNTTGLFTAPSGIPPGIGNALAGGIELYEGTITPQSHIGLTGGTTYYYRAFSWNGTSWSAGVGVSAITNIDAPTSFTATTVAVDEIDLAYTKNVLANDVIIATNSTNTFGIPANGTTYAAGNSLPTAGTVIYAGPLSTFNHTGLFTFNAYYYKIWSVDAFNWYSATGATANATTFCTATVSPPYTENFESYTVPAVGCGRVVDQNADGITWVSGTANAHGGTKNLQIASSSTIPNDDWYFVNGINLTSGTMYTVTFWYRPLTTNGVQKLEVKCGSYPSASGMTSPAIFNVTMPTSPIAYWQGTFNYTPSVSGIYYFGWHSLNDVGTNSTCLDDISVFVNACAKPLTVTAGNITNSGADIGWTGGAANVQVEFGAPGHLPGAGTIVATAANPYTISTLFGQTTYEAYVRKDCGSGSYSDWTGPISFATLPNPAAVVTLPATAITSVSATLNGTYNTNGVLYNYIYFEYGLTQSYGMVSASLQDVNSTSPTAYFKAISGLIPSVAGTTYHYRFVAFSTANVSYGNDLTFTTTAVGAGWTGGANTTEWNNAGNWTGLSGSIPGSGTTVVIPGGLTYYPHVTAASFPPTTPATCGTLTINPGASLTVEPGAAFTISASLTNNAGPTGLVIKCNGSGAGSLITTSSSVQATVERYITHWTDDNHGWHLLSSPVDNTIQIRPNFVPFDPIGGSQDFYAWDEVNDYWFNSKDVSGNWVNTFDATFTPGKGYLVAYQGDVTKSFHGNLNVANVTRGSLTRTTTGIYATTPWIDPGWQLVGNPFTCALTWYTGWTMTNIAAVAKIWSETGAAYVDVIAGGTIPAMQGFMVNVTTAPGSLTIPIAQRKHDPTAWYKSTGNPFIKLVAKNTAAQTAQESIVTFDSQAGPGFDPAFDSRFLRGYAPEFYSVDDKDHLSTNVLPVLNSQTTIPFNFVKTTGSDYTIEAVTIDNVPGQVYLTDLKSNRTQNLTENPVYSFIASAGDDTARFLLSFSHVGINEHTVSDNRIYTYGNNLFIVNPGKARLEIYTITGQKLLAEEIESPAFYRTSLHVVTGYYIARLTTGTKVVVTKVFIKS